MNSIVPIKIGIKFEPASLILVYRDKSKLRSRQIPVKNLDILTDVNIYSENFKLNEKYRKYFDKIPVTRLAKLIFIIQDNMKGYTLKESLERAKKFDDNNHAGDDVTSASEITTESHANNKKKAAKTIDDYDIDDFHDTDDEDDKKSVSTIEEIKKKNDDLSSTNKKSDALNILSTQLKTVKSNLYDFEDDDDDEEEEDESEDDDDDEDEDNLKKDKKKKSKDDEKIETALDDDVSESSF